MIKPISKNIFTALLIFALLPEIYSQPTDGTNTTDDSMNEESEKVSYLFESTVKNLGNRLSAIINQSNTLTDNQGNIMNSLSNIVVNIKNLDVEFKNKLINLQDKQNESSGKIKKLTEAITMNQELSNSNLISVVKGFDGSTAELIFELSNVKSMLNENQKQFIDFKNSQLNTLTNLVSFAEEAKGSIKSNRALLYELKNKNTKLGVLIDEIDNQVEIIVNQQDANHKKTEAILAKIESRLSLSFVLKSIVVTISLILAVFIWKYKHIITQVINGAPYQGKER